MKIDDQQFQDKLETLMRKYQNYDSYESDERYKLEKLTSIGHHHDEIIDQLKHREENHKTTHRQQIPRFEIRSFAEILYKYDYIDLIIASSESKTKAFVLSQNKQKHAKFVQGCQLFEQTLTNYQINYQKFNFSFYHREYEILIENQFIYPTIYEFNFNKLFPELDLSYYPTLNILTNVRQENGKLKLNPQIYYNNLEIFNQIRLDNLTKLQKMVETSFNHYFDSLIWIQDKRHEKDDRLQNYLKQNDNLNYINQYTNIPFHYTSLPFDVGLDQEFSYCRIDNRHYYSYPVTIYAFDPAKALNNRKLDNDEIPQGLRDAITQQINSHDI